MAETTPRSMRRVVIAFDHCRQDRQAMLQAVELAERLQAELIALFVEDEQLFQLAQLPFSQEISRTSGLIRKLELGDLTRAMTRQVDELQQLLVQSAGKRIVHTSVKVVRGRFAVEALAAAGDTDAVVVSVMNQRERPLSAFGRTQREPLLSATGQIKPIWVLYDGSPISIHAVELAADSSASGGVGLIVAICTDQDRQAQSLRDQAVDLLKDRVAPVQFYRFSSRDSRELLGRLEDRGCSLLMMSHQDPILTGDSGARVFESVSCPVVLVR